MNSGLGGPFSDGKLSLDELGKRLPSYGIFEEEPLTGPGNYIIAWGYDATQVKKNFKDIQFGNAAAGSRSI